MLTPEVLNLDSSTPANPKPKPTTLMSKVLGFRHMFAFGGHLLQPRPSGQVSTIVTIAATTIARFTALLQLVRIGQNLSIMLL